MTSPKPVPSPTAGPNETDEWQLLEKIGDGGNSDVFRASHPVHGIGAVKVLRLFDTAKKQEKRFRRFSIEIRKLQLLNDIDDMNGVMPIIEYGELTDSRLWYAMPLAERLEAPSEAHQWALRTAENVSNTLKAVHAEGVVHRDIKPSNVLVLDGTVVVADFGLARSVDDPDLTDTNERVGSYRYTAPEAHLRFDEPHFPLDVYSLAKMTWVLLTGEELPPDGPITEDDHMTKYGFHSPYDLNTCLRWASSNEYQDRPTMSEFSDEISRALRSIDPDENEIVEASTSDGPAMRARNLFSTEATQNAREHEVETAYKAVISISSDAMKSGWAAIVTELGWSGSISSSTARPPSQTAHISQGWTELVRYQISGAIGDNRHYLVVTTRRLAFDDSRTLRFGITISVEQGNPGTSGAIEAVILDDTFETLVFDPALSETLARVRRVISEENTQYRIVEKLNELRPE